MTSSACVNFSFSIKEPHEELAIRTEGEPIAETTDLDDTQCVAPRSINLGSGR
jgi:hypothetical protein